MSDHLAHWISEKPVLIEKLKQNPQLEEYLRHKEHPAITKVDETWNQLVRQLSQ